MLHHTGSRRGRGGVNLRTDRGSGPGLARCNKQNVARGQRLHICIKTQYLGDLALGGVFQ